MTQVFQCENCKHYLSGLRCVAFPDGIPDDILSGEFDHTQPHEDDNGIQYTPSK